MKGFLIFAFTATTLLLATLFFVPTSSATLTAAHSTFTPPCGNSQTDCHTPRATATHNPHGGPCGDSDVDCKTPKPTHTPVSWATTTPKAWPSSTAVPPTSTPMCDGRIDCGTATPPTTATATSLDPASPTPLPASPTSVGSATPPPAAPTSVIPSATATTAPKSSSPANLAPAGQPAPSHPPVIAAVTPPATPPVQLTQVAAIALTKGTLPHTGGLEPIDVGLLGTVLALAGLGIVKLVRF